MKKTFLFLLVGLAVCLGTSAADRYSDSLQRLIKSKADPLTRIDACYQFAKYQLFRAPDFSDLMIPLNEAVNIAQKAGLIAEEGEARYWQVNIAWATRSPAARNMWQDAMAFARKNNLPETESTLLTIASVMTVNKDSVALLQRQALAIADKYNLALPRARAYVNIGMRIIASQPDSAVRLFVKALAIYDDPAYDRKRFLMTQYLMRNLSSINNTLAIDYARKAIAKEQGSGKLPFDFISMMMPSIVSQAPLFNRDSLDYFYNEIMRVSRAAGIDTVNSMQNYIQSSQDIGNNNAALQTGFQLIRIGESTKDSASLLRSYYGVGLSYKLSGSYASAKAYFLKSLQFRKWDDGYYAFSLDDLSGCHQMMGNADSARYYSRACYQYSATYWGSEDEIFGGILNDLGITHFKLGDDSLALAYLQRSYRYFRKEGNSQPSNFALTTDALATYFLKHGQADSVRIYAGMALQVARENGFPKVVVSSANSLYQHFLGINKYDSALHYKAISFDAYQELFNDKTTQDYQRLINEEQRRVDEATSQQRLADQRYSNNLKIYGLLALLVVALIVAFIVIRNNRHRRKSYELLKRQKAEIDEQKLRLEESIVSLNSTQAQLIQAEKMASLGELTAGIAHEIQNPLNFVNNFSEVSAELIDEMNAELVKGDITEARIIAGDLKQNLEKINHHGKRADSIVKGMLQHSRSSSGQKEPTDINALADEYLRLAYHGLRAKDKSFNASIETDFDKSIGKINIIPQDLGRVLLNLITNAFYAVIEKKITAGAEYDPRVEVITRRKHDAILVQVRDNGNGIPPAIIDKVLQPFFTTKPTGQGTGLGLSLSYDIVKAHGGELTVESESGEGAVFTIRLPV